MGTRAGGSGLQFDVRAKQAAKFNQDEAKIALEWIKDKSGNSSMDVTPTIENFSTQLKDGTKLVAFINGIEPGVVKKVSKPTSAAFCQDNISNFLTACGKLGVPKEQLFQTVDLFEQRDLFSVLMTLRSLARVLREQGRSAIKF